MFKEKQKIICVEAGTTLADACAAGLPGLPSDGETYTVEETSKCDCCDNPIVRVMGLEDYFPHQWFRGLDS